MLGLTTSCLILCSTDLTRRAVRIMNKLVDLSIVSTKYHKFANIFIKAKAETLASYHLYNLQIKLEDGENLPIRVICLLSTTKQEALKEFINKNLNIRFI